MLHVKVWKHLWGIKDDLMKFNTLSLLLDNIPFSILYFGKCEKQTSFIMIHSAPWAGKRRIWLKDAPERKKTDEFLTQSNQQVNQSAFKLITILKNAPQQQAAS